MLRSIVILFKKTLYLETSIEFVNLNDQLVDIFTKSLLDLELIIYVTSLVHTIYMHHLDGKCGM